MSNSIEVKSESHSLYDSDRERRLIEGGQQFYDGEKNDVRGAILKFKNRIEKDFMKIAGLLYRVRKHGLHKDWNYDCFEDYVEDELGFKRRKALYFINIWKELKIRMDVESDKLNKLGWTKTKEIVQLDNKNDKKELISESLDNDLTVKEVKRKVKEKNSGDDEDVEHPENISFKVYDEQKDIINQAIKKASKEANSDKRGHILELICLHYLSSSFGGQEVQFLLDRIEDVFENIEIRAVDDSTGEVVYGYIDEGQ
jgi:hypothetical protein